MFVIVGLGNPGKDYAGTRHNIGFEVIYNIADKFSIRLDREKFKAIIGEGKIDGEKVMLVMPLTYMNLSGDSVKDILSFYKLTNEDIVIVYDDISLDVGKIRVRSKGSAGGHNGIKNIINKIGTENFKRVRVGVGEKPEKWDLADYVLSRFTKDEDKAIIEAIEKSTEAVEIIVKDGIDKAMNKYN